ncbi:hypothetical protein [Flavobacterium sp. FlaQc-48]|uniref:hypothetical protein n=1 Tax=Flavobacterium sp. FlaQc-48 TaxID=3374181 RepID=UPI0037583B53
MLTEDHWVFSDSIFTTGKNIEFYYPVYIELPDKCNFKIHESYDLLERLFENQKVLRVKNEIYYIQPVVWHAEIK